MKRTIFWGIMRVARWVSTYVSEEHIAGGRWLSTCFHAGFLLSLYFRPWKWKQYVPPKRRLKADSEPPSTCFHAGFLLSLFFLPWKWRQYFPPKRMFISDDKPPAFTLVSCSAYLFYPEDGGNIFLRNVGWNQMTSHLLSRWFLAQLIFLTLKMEAIFSSET
jgi:hypothetical protein